jgi:hypothetical protein
VTLRLALFVAALASCEACSNADVRVPVEGLPEAGRGDARVDAVAEAGPGYLPSRLPPDFHCDPTLESLRDTIFVTSCGYDSCHGDNNFAYGLWLTADIPRISSELVGAPSESCKPELLVAPGDADHSFLYNKLSEKKPACGARMPYGIEPLPDSALTCVRDWIEGL